MPTITFKNIRSKFLLLDPWISKIGIAAAFLISIKLSLSYIAIIPLILWYLTTRFSTDHLLKTDVSPYLLPLMYLFLIMLLSAPFGRSPINSISESLRFAFLIMLIPCFFELSKKTHPMWFIGALTVGQSVAALHTVLQGGFPEVFPRIFIGEVTEAGQLAISAPLVFGCILYLILIHKDTDWIKSIIVHIVRGSLLIAALGVFAFHEYFNSSNKSLAFISAVILGFCGWAIITGTKRLLKDPVPIGLKLLCSTALPLIIAALVINLKRGPWLGAFCAFTVLLFIYERRLIPLAVLAAIGAWFIEPIHQRLINSYNHFFIAGGRGEIWEIGGELLLKHPIGIGYENSPLLRSFSQQIPPELTHFHSNIINIGVELGWIGLFIYLWWIFVTCRPMFTAAINKSSLGIAICAGLFSWHIAGLVEYNFGDSEVAIIAFILIGLLPKSLESNNGAK